MDRDVARTIVDALQYRGAMQMQRAWRGYAAQRRLSRLGSAWRRRNRDDFGVVGAMRATRYSHGLQNRLNANFHRYRFIHRARQRAQAATRIQRIARGNLIRNDYGRFQYPRVSMASRVYAARARIDANAAAAAALRARRAAAATRLQSVARMFLSRKRVRAYNPRTGQVVRPQFRGL